MLACGVLCALAHGRSCEPFLSAPRPVFCTSCVLGDGHKGWCKSENKTECKTSLHIPICYFLVLFLWVLGLGFLVLVLHHHQFLYSKTKNKKFMSNVHESVVYLLVDELLELYLLACQQCHFNLPAAEVFLTLHSSLIHREMRATCEDID